MTARVEAEKQEAYKAWKEKIISEHLVYIKGVEIVYYEFKEILLELAMRFKDQLDAAPGKLRSLVKKFLDEMFLKRLTPFMKFNAAKAQSSSATAATAATKRTWPKSAKDEEIKAIMDERKKKAEEEERLKQEEAERQAQLEAEAKAQAAQDEVPAAEEEVKNDEEEKKSKAPEDSVVEEDEDEEDEEMSEPVDSEDY